MFFVLEQSFSDSSVGHRLSTKIQAAIQKIKKDAMPLLERYNEACRDLRKPEDITSYDEICNLDSDFWSESSELDLRALREHMNKLRAEEELAYVQVRPNKEGQ